MSKMRQEKKEQSEGNKKRNTFAKSNQNDEERKLKGREQKRKWRLRLKTRPQKERRVKD